MSKIIQTAMFPLSLSVIIPAHLFTLQLHDLCAKNTNIHASLQIIYLRRVEMNHPTVLTTQLSIY